MPAPLEATMFAITQNKLRVGNMNSKVWPHVSVVPWVNLRGLEQRREVFDTAHMIAGGVDRVVLEPGEMTTVGAPGYEKSAQAVESEGLRELHSKLLTALGSLGIEVSHPEWTGEGYFPHITAPEPVFDAPFPVDTLQVIENKQFVRGIGTKVVIHQLRVGS